MSAEAGRGGHEDGCDGEPRESGGGEQSAYGCAGHVREDIGSGPGVDSGAGFDPDGGLWNTRGMLSLSLAAPMAAAPCADGEQVCDLVYDWTGNARFADWADVLIGTPLAIIGLVLFGLVVRWMLHRVVARIARRAEKGVLPERARRWRRSPAARNARRRWPASSRA